jgi:membrane-bound metal-dependent hydrolase YbcI (DUF457 family)
MTTVGHTLAGIAIGVLCLPERKSACWKALYFVVFALLPNIPDLPLPWWGHERYEHSHSLLVNLLAILGMIAVLAWRTDMHGRFDGKILAGGGVAWLSHLLLDSLYRDGKGVPILWPFSDAKLHLPIPWFSVVPVLPPVTEALLRELAVEFLSYSPLVLLAFGLRGMRKRAW